MSTVNGSWPLPRLVAALARAGWDVFEGRRGGGYRSVMHALCILLPHGSATGQTTAPQIADAAGISERWARHILTALDDAGVITWTRGTVINGRPEPSLIRVNKRKLADLVRRARPIHDAELAARAAATAARIRETIRSHSIRRRAPRPVPPVKRRTATARAELNATLPPYGEVTGPAPRVPAPVASTIVGKPKPRSTRFAQVRALMAQRAADRGEEPPC